MTVSSKDGDDKRHHRAVRSFVIRGGRLTRSQQRALDELWPQYGIDFTGERLDLDTVFSRTAERVLEIGFGNGSSLALMAAAEPEKDFLGIEVHPPGVGSLLLQIKDLGLSNIRIMQHDAVEVLEQCIPAASFDRIQIYFADPWPKKKHHKRRIIQPPFVKAITGIMKPGAILHLATDWQDYAEHMLLVLDAEPQLKNLSNTNSYIPRPEWRPQTRFETRGQKLGHAVWDLLFLKSD